MVLQWDTLKAGLVVCPVQRDGGAEGGHVSDDRRVGSGCMCTYVKRYEKRDTIE